MGGFHIDGHNLFGKLFKPTEKTGDNSTTINPVSVPMTENVEEKTNTRWTELMGVNISSQTSEQSYFTDEELTAFVSQYATDISPDTREDVASSMEGILSADFDVAENVVPEVADAYIGHHVDGTAQRIKSENGTRLFASDIDDAIGGDVGLLDIAGLLFDDAARRNTV